MQPFPASLFSGGPALRILDVAIRAQESRGELSLDAEIQRYIRTIHSDWVADWNCSVYAASGVLELAAGFVRTSSGPSDLPPDFRGKLERACGDMNPAEYLEMLAEIVRMLDRQVPLDYEELPMSGWEFRLAFPYLFGLDAILMDEGGREFSDHVRSVVTAEHPYCRAPASAYTTEAQRAMILFPGEDGLRGRLHWATRERLVELIDTVSDHMQREHS
ncbi:hypothetical protein [Streptomyces sp. NPDC006691]|uniref:hypothetical protein n=1 Tax=Streptomyces sp. NPDC006691 TaxID=3364757 RepID=UPI0036B106DC